MLESNIIVAKQSSKEIVECIKKNISNNKANKYFFNEDYNFVSMENDFFYYEDKYGTLEDLEILFEKLRKDKNFIKERDKYFKNWIGSPTRLLG